jgi:Mn-containing catalase
MSTTREDREDPEQPWTTGPSADGKSEYSYTPEQPDGGAPDVEDVIDEMYNDVN